MNAKIVEIFGISPGPSNPNWLKFSMSPLWMLISESFVFDLFGAAQPDGKFLALISNLILLGSQMGNIYSANFWYIPRDPGYLICNLKLA